MGKGSYRTMVYGGASIARTAAVGTLCTLLLGGCQTLEEIRAWEPFDTEGATESATAAEGTDEAVTAPVGDEVALDPALINEVQSKLAELGYEPGSVDGVMGPKTRAAIRRYQVVVGLPVDGRVSEPLLARLTGSSAAERLSQPEEEAAIEAPTGVAAGLMPAYEVGSRYVYADGEVRTVVEVDGDQVYWKSSTGGHALSDRNFLIPPLSWVSPQTSGKRSLDSASDELWLHQGGTEVTFSTKALVAHRARPNSQSHVTETWQCRLEDEGRLNLRAGAFETRQIICNGLSEPAGTRLTRIWHYAPEIAHYVVFEEIDGSHRLMQRSELLAIVPSTGDWPPVAQAGLGWALEHALETAAAGEETTWTSSAVETEVTIEPGPPAAAAQDKTCRSFVQIWAQPEGKRVYPGYSCRDSSGQWLIPGLEPGVEVAKSAE